jgi:acetyl esterase
LNRKRRLPLWVNDILEGMNDAYVGRLHDRAPGELDLADPLHVFERRERPDRALPAFFVPIGTRDPLLDDTRRLDRALKAMGVECEARYYEGELHAFHALLWRRQARRCWREQLSFLGRASQHPREPRHEFVAQA